MLFDVVFLVVFSCSFGVFVTGIAQRSTTANVEHFTMVKANGSDVFRCLQPHPQVGNQFGKRWDREEMKGFWKGPSMCANCVACAAMVFGLMEEFAKGRAPTDGDNQLNVICDRRMPRYRIWDVSGIRYFGDPTVNARSVLEHDSLAPSIRFVCNAMRKMTTGHQLYSLWRQDESKFMNRLCFNPYFYPGLASCRGLLKRTKGITRMHVCRKPFWALTLSRIFTWDSKSYTYCEEKEYRTLINWYTLGDHDHVE